jgi:hypothetical protein
MFALHTFVSLVQQMACLVPAHSARFTRHRNRTVDAQPSGDCLGLCPSCRKYVVVRFATDQRPVAGPQCGQLVSALDPPG